MSVVDESQIQELERFLQQSMIGIHHLFEKDSITEILRTPNEETDFFNTENADRIQQLMIQLAQCPSLASKKHFLEDLDPESYELVVRTYFQIVDSTLLSSNISKH